MNPENGIALKLEPPKKSVLYSIAVENFKVDEGFRMKVRYS